ncbi:MAG TPA: phosphatase PAP2 family protein [Vicinamibacterales bacterium]|jgi:hypothetical protein|nr:phosphatase PAP2 family protein [Vicinamibacterales bacterium]
MSWPAVTVVFFGYAAVVAWTRPDVRLATRRHVTVLAAVAMAGAAASAGLAAGVLRHWIIPPLFLLASYWTSGMLFVRPMPGTEAMLLRIDRILGVCSLARRTPIAVAGCLELAYVSVYPLIPAALAIHLAYSPAPDPDRFWTVILATDFICFGMLPWIQTRPPRDLDSVSTWRAPLRAANERLLHHASIRVNTFPSGHAAEAAAAALLLIDAPPILLACVIVNAVAISAAAVLGRYHYAADAILGWLTALLVVSII